MELSINNQLLSIVSDFISNSYVLLFLLSMLPVTELRLSLPLGILALNLPWQLVLSVCVVSNAMIGIFLVYSLDWGLNLFSRIAFFEKIINYFMVRSKKSHQKYKKYKQYALILFVGIPLPGTGAWTGALMSYVIGLDKKRSSFSILIGVLLSGFIMTALSLSGKILLS